MRIILLYPPIGDLTQAYPSLPYLAAFLKSEGYDVIQKDINIEVFNLLLSKGRLKESYKMVSRKLKNLEKRKYLPQKMQDLYFALNRAVMISSYVINNIEKAKMNLRDKKDFYDYKKYLWSWDVISSGFKLISAEFFPTSVSFDSYKMEYDLRYDSVSIDKIAELISNKKENPFLETFEKHIVPSIISQNPNIVGISIPYFHQVIPAFTLANLIKRKNKDIHITIGGASVSIIAESLLKSKQPPFFLDSIIIREGEHALLELVKRLEGKKDLKDVPNCIYRDSKGVHNSKINFVEDINVLPTPCFEGLPFNLYFSPKPVLPLSITRGCYWNKCAFCSYGLSEVTRCSYRQRKEHLVIQDIDYLIRKYNTKYFFFSVDVIHPSLLARVSSMLLKKNLDIRWQCDARFEKQFGTNLCHLIYKAGCRNISFGLESASQRVLNLMEKGTRLDIIENVLKNCHKARIAVNLGCFVGFPTEKRSEANKTADFILKHKNLIFSFGSTTYGLLKGSKVAKCPENYGIKITKKGYETLSYEALTGMGMKEAQRIHSGLCKKLYETYHRLTFPYNGEDAHTLLYLSYYQLERFRKLTTDCHNSHYINKQFKDLKPCAKNTIFIRRCKFNPGKKQPGAHILPDRKWILYSNNSGQAAFINPKMRPGFLLHLCNGKNKAEEIISKIIDEYGPSRVSDIAENITVLKKIIEFWGAKGNDNF